MRVDLPTLQINERTDSDVIEGLKGEGERMGRDGREFYPKL